MKSCWQCGESIGQYSRFCFHCGVRLDKKPERRVVPHVEVDGSDSLSGHDRHRNVVSEIKLNRSLHETLSEQYRRLQSEISQVEEKIRLHQSGEVLPETSSEHQLSATPTSSATIELQVAYQPQVSYALYHAGYPFILQLKVTNSTNRPVSHLLLQVWVTHCSEPLEIVIDEIPGGGIHAISDLSLPLDAARFEDLRESRQEHLRLSVEHKGRILRSKTLPVDVWPLWNWMYHPAVAATTACFVLPNSPEVEEVVSLAQKRLLSSGERINFDDYQSHSRERVTAMVRSLYEVFQLDLGIAYISPPRSFEQPQVHADGTRSFSQKIRNPEPILTQRRGTCLDLALFFAACIEHLGLNPVVFLIEGHAFMGYWAEEKTFGEPVASQHRQVAAALKNGTLIALNSTTFTLDQGLDFAESERQGREFLASPDLFLAAIDIKECRKAGMKPLR